MLRVQCNEDTIQLDSPIRFAIDKNIKNPTCYKITQNDNSAYNYGKGICCITVTEDEFNQDNDKLIQLDDSTKVWICDYRHFDTPPLPDHDSDLSVQILGSKQLKVGVPRKYSVKFTDKFGNDIDWKKVNFTWNIISNFEVQLDKNNNNIQLLIKDDSHIGESFLLQIFVDNKCIEKIKISIIDV